MTSVRLTAEKSGAVSSLQGSPFTDKQPCNVLAEHVPIVALDDLDTNYFSLLSNQQ